VQREPTTRPCRCARLHVRCRYHLPLFTCTFQIVTRSSRRAGGGGAVWSAAAGRDRSGDRSRHSVRVLEGDGQRVPRVVRAVSGVARRGGAGRAGGCGGRHAAGGGVRVRPGQRGCRSRCSSRGAGTRYTVSPRPGRRTCASSCAGTRNRTGSTPRRCRGCPWPTRPGCGLCPCRRGFHERLTSAKGSA
jgi:hypothetical protein